MTSLIEDAIVAAATTAAAAAGGVTDLRSATRAIVAQLGGGRLQDDTLADIFEDALHREDTALVPVPGDRVAEVGLLVRGIVLTHRLTEGERAAHTLDLDPDLGPLARLATVDGGLHLPDGATLHRRDRRVRGGSRAGGVLWTAHLEGPAGWLDDRDAGALLCLRAGEGVLRVEALDGPAPGPGPEPAAFGEALAQVLDDANEGDGSPVWDETLHIGLAADHRDWFAEPGPPFGELVTAAGFEVDGRDIGRAGCWEEHEALARMVMTATRHDDLSTDDHRVLRDALEAFDTWCAQPGDSPGSLAVRLHDRWLAALAFLDEVRWRGATADQIGGFAMALGARSHGGESATVGHWLASRAAALDGRALDGERLVAEAQAADPTFPAAIDEAAWYASDRRRARDAVNLLHRVRRHDDPELELLRRYAALGAPGVGRNSPCPCESGRKFKHCHLGRMELPEPDRVRWLLDKTRDFVVRVAPPDVVADLEGHDPEPSTHMMAYDLLLFADGWLGRFLASRGPLLDEWERVTAAGWSSGGVASLFRVEGIDADGRRRLVDLATGVARTAEASPAFELASLHRLLCCRLLPVGDCWYGSGVTRLVMLSERERLLDALGPDVPSADTMRALVGSGDGPRLQNTSGEPLMACRATLRPPAALAYHGLVALLDKMALERGDEEWDEEEQAETLVWRLVRDTPGMDAATIATVRLTAGGELSVETSSVARHDATLALLTDAVDGFEVVAEERVPLARAQAEHERAECMAPARRVLGLEDAADDAPDLDDDIYDPDDSEGDLDEDPELAAALEQIDRQFESRWLDQPVPALGGATPRAAAADDELRPDLLTLLAEMEGRGRFDPDRLRAALGLA